MNTFNLMTCAGWKNAAIFGGCSQAWLIVGAIFILGMIMKRQTDDGILAGTSYNWLAGMALGIIACILLITFFGEARWGMLGGIVGLALGGFGAAFIGLGDGSGGE